MQAPEVDVITDGDPLPTAERTEKDGEKVVRMSTVSVATGSPLSHPCR